MRMLLAGLVAAYLVEESRAQPAAAAPVAQGLDAAAEAALVKALSSPTVQAEMAQQANSAVAKALATNPQFQTLTPFGPMGMVAPAPVPGAYDANLDRMLLFSAHEGTHLFGQGRYDEAYSQFRWTLIGALSYLAQKGAATDALRERVRWALGEAELMGGASWERAVLLRTAINDIRNAPWRGAAGPGSLLFRLGGPLVLARVWREAFAACSRDAGLASPFDGDEAILPFLGLEFGTFAGRAGAACDSVGRGPYAHYPTYRQHAAYQPVALARSLRLSLRKQCVPEPEVRELLTAWGVGYAVYP